MSSMMRTGLPVNGEAVFGDLLAAADVGAVLLDAQGEVVAANAVFTRLAATHGLTVVDALRCGDVATATQTPWRHALAGQPSALEVNVGTREDPLWLHACAEPVHDDRGGSIGVLVTFHPQVKRPREELSPEEYVAIVSHDLRHPLNNIYLRAQLLERELRALGQAHACEAVSTICANVQRMDAMIKELIDVHRAETGALRLVRQRVDLSELVRDAVATTLPPQAREQISISAESPVWIEGDRHLLERVFANLLSNASKYSRGTGTIRLEVHASDGGDALASVADSGPGIDAESMPHLFEKFFRARRDQDHFAGNGLGLYGTKMIVEAHGGHIWAESGHGQGAIFHLMLPNAIASSDDRRSASISGGDM